ncbi:uncharacterized protein BYT42DRAFT_500969 [Radiomyces spectabilis]|uniref:uncharacterized protein n=1 Tax=Radiomyces spectabilis TaxID=64574 RepID=UPI00221F39E7|nr:uncharacterized protein BYT42DRAFT_500969 [Radiomyces spectabilis]KAI8372906.1 hypothetical protein BYT42DRAFT_500969 [Radiomyces spectabilis]
MAMSIFGKELLDNLTHTLRTDAVDYNIGLPDAVYLEVSKLITALSMNETTADEVILQIMIISAPLPYGQCRLLRGLANMIQKLPDTPAAKNCIKEMALWSTFYDPMLSCLLADPSRKVHLQWVDTIPAEGGQSRPDAVIVEKQQRLFVRSRGYGEAKAEGRSPHDISVDFIRLAVFSKDTIDVHQLDSAIGFQIHGFIITFYLSQLLPSGVNVMFEIARISFPRSLEGLPAFFNLRNVHLLLAINDVFWRLCVVSSNRAAIANRYRSTPSNWQDFVDNRQDSLRMPSLRIDQ